ncbi:hypothetical protein ONZ51_g1714 [Trametes cubensis]|uniref:SH3 domain-containing protein n=1 Tax=Trametes cubensis TaxID=1111947 RepID=A0AAD7XFI8_9APHY|nr:hypothetical protein ONZ51_g1714 [Trametes cubensis]
MDLWSILGYKQKPLRSANWVYLFVVNVWNYLKTLLAAYHDEQAPPTPPRRLQSPAASPPTPEPEPAMASVVTQETTDLRLTLPVEKASTSPFPSPGSPFYPPTAPRRTRVRIAPIVLLVDQEHLAQSERHQRRTSRYDQHASTPTPNSVFQVKTPTTQITVPDPPPDSDSSVSLSTAALTTQNRDSLTSSRPAPPSPAASRRTSAALSRHSSTARSRRQSKASSLLQVSHEPEASSSSVATITPSAQAQQKRRSLVFKIRDFAYEPSDDRHVGRGPDAPRANRPRQRWSTFSAASSSSATSSSHGEEDEDDAVRGSWGAYRWNTLSNHFSWGPEDGPSRMDFARNFDVSSPTDETGDPHGDSEDGEEYEDANEGEGDDGPLPPGLYRALYAFEPEGTAEMALEEEQVVHVVGRGGGVGWAVVEKEGGGHALVPESYLELVEAD